MSNATEVFSHRFHNVDTAAALSHKRLRTPVVAYFAILLKRRLPAQSKLKEQPAARGLAKPRLTLSNFNFKI